MSFPSSFSQSVNLAKVQRDVINQWITERITQVLGFEDEIVISMVINLLEPKVDEKLDPRQLQIAITGFLEKETPTFMEELWDLLLSAQANPTGIPTAILEKKKQELQQLAKEKDQLRDVLDRKKQDFASSSDRGGRPSRFDAPPPRDLDSAGGNEEPRRGRDQSSREQPPRSGDARRLAENDRPQLKRRSSRSAERRRPQRRSPPPRRRSRSRSLTPTRRQRRQQ